MTEENITSEKSDTITIKKDSLWKYSTFALLAILVIGAIAVFAGDRGAPTGAVIGAQNPPTQGATASALEFNPENDNYKGNPNADIVLYEFSDFQCPFCSRAAPTVNQIEQEFGDKVVIVYKHFPLTSIHPEAQKSAEASECAAEQDKFWEYHDGLFANQGLLSSPYYKQLAGDLGLDQAQFDNCLDSGKYSSKVNSELDQGVDAGVRGTPGFLLVKDGQGQLISGAQPFPVFKEAIESKL